MLSESSKGVFAISVTPFTDDGAIDYDSVESVVEFYLQRKVSGITILGVMGEASQLKPDESITFMEHVIRVVGGRVPVVVGVSNPVVTTIKRMARAAMEAGSAGVMLAPQSGLDTDARLYDYYASVLNMMGPDVPVVYQDYPQLTGTRLTVEAFGRLVDNFPQLVMLKHEEAPGLGKLSKIRAAEREGRRRVSILVGNNAMYYPQELRRGADGAMTGFAFPEMLVGVFERFYSGNVEGADDLYDLYLPLIRYEQQPGIGLAIRKEVLRRRGAIKSAKLRALAPPLALEDLGDIAHLVERLERKLANGRA